MKLLTIRPALLLAVLLWLGLVAFGYSKLLRYSFTEGGLAPAPRNLPASLASTNASRRSQMFLALHPRCPCSRATVREMAKILTRAAGRVDVTVLVYMPGAPPEFWMQNAMLEECRRLNCRMRPDPEGKLAAALGSLTSGTVALYDTEGRLRYRGGITAARGHEGDNPGASAVVEILTGTSESFRSMPVFGCPIQERPPESASATSPL